MGIWDVAAIAVKALGYATTFGAAGAVYFHWLCHPLIADADVLAIRRLTRGLCAGSVLAGAAQVLVTARSLNGDSADIADLALVRMVWQAGLGRALTIRAIGLLLVAFTPTTRRPSWLAVAGAVMAATSFAWLGHAHSIEPHGLPVMLLSVHLLGVAFWLGALAPLSIVARRAEVLRLAAVAARFGAAAVLVVSGLMMAGAALLWMLLGDYTLLWGSPYGRYMMLKLAFVAALLCFAAFNKLRLTPRLLTGDLSAVRGLCTSMRIEMILGAVILLVTATFTSTTGPPALH